MENPIKQEFREDEVAIIRHWDKARNEWVSNVFPKIGGRLRLAHEQNETITIETEIYKYDENIAVVIGTCRTAKGSFRGIGMSSVARDQKIAPAILELAETRSIARALRFAGFGVEYCSAEEISHLEMNANEKGNSRPEPMRQIEPPLPDMTPPTEGNQSLPNKTGRVEIGFTPVDNAENVYRPQFKAVQNQARPENNSNANGAKRRQLSIKQFNYIKSLGKERFGHSLRDLSDKAFKIYGVELEGLNTSDASSFIHLLESGEICSAAI